MTNNDISRKTIEAPGLLSPFFPESTSEAGCGADREQLPEPVETGLWRLAADAQKVVIQYEAYRRALMPLIEVVE